MQWVHTYTNAGSLEFVYHTKDTCNYFRNGILIISDPENMGTSLTPYVCSYVQYCPITATKSFYCNDGTN